jgi:hypothetical protein
MFDEKHALSFRIIPGSKELASLIGERILDIGRFTNRIRDINELEMKKYLIEYHSKPESGYESFYPSDWLARPFTHTFLILENKSACIFCPADGLFKLYLSFDFSIEQLEFKYIRSQTKWCLFTALNDPEFNNEFIQEMIGKRILGIDIILLSEVMDIKAYGMPHPEYGPKYGGLIFHLEGGIKKALGLGLDLKLTESLEYYPMDKIRPEIIREIISVE